ncbi:MAG TPA: dihydrofolate reductase family protein [Pyrinomonadaceae bacterium]|jgi:dihydrofolate reductase|nr:dihydrofolate reductase family protein [Pyrinomonadaceae bacterium]
MRKVTFRVANSLDNYIARKDGAVDWILGGEEASSAMTDFWKTLDTVVIGRKTYEPVLKSGAPFPTYPGVKNYVISRTLKENSDQNVEIIREDAAEFIRKLKTQDGKDIFVMGGGLLAKSLFEANLIDEVGVNIHPVLLGSGIPLFHEMSRQIDLELIECKSFKNGCVLVTYRVKS